MSNIDLSALRTFVAISELRNMTEAARHLRTTQAAVSQRLKKLETQLRVRLIDRELRPIEPTSAGHMLLKSARRILAEIEQIEFALSERNDLPLRELRIGIADSLGATLVPPLVKEIRGSIDQLAIRVASSVDLCRLFLHRNLDAVISSDPLSQREDLERAELCFEPMVLVFNQAEKVDGDSELPMLKKLARERPFIRYSPVSPLAVQIETHLQRLHLAPLRNLELNASEGVLEMVRGGLGWTITTPMCLLQSGPDLRRLRVHKLPFANMGRSITLLARTHELGSFFERLTTISRSLIRRQIALRFGSELPWLIPMIKIQGEEIKNQSGKKSTRAKPRPGRDKRNL